MAFNIWGFPYLAMIPVIGREDLELTASMIGAVTAVEGALGWARALRPDLFKDVSTGALSLNLAVEYTACVE